jgi:hypothetical protein
MTTLPRPRGLNNQGAELLISGRSSEALKAFQSALHLLASAVAKDNGGEGNVIIHISTVCKLDNDVPEFALGQSCSVVPADLHTEHFFVYNQAITITEPSIPNCNNETISQLSSAVLFNLALLFHREGMIGSEVSLKKASSLYARCLEALSLNAAVQSKQTTTVLAIQQCREHDSPTYNT